MSSDLTEVISADGTKLSARVSGTGSPLVLVHGTSGSKDSWAGVAPLLGEHHTVWAYDRRGRGQSGDNPEYALEREVEDLQAVLAATGPTAQVVGHSFGAVCALDAAAAGAALRSLVLYEPPVYAHRSSDAIGRAAAHLEAGDREQAVATFLTDVAGCSEGELAFIRSMPEEWSRFIDRAPTVVRETEALASLTWDPSRFRSVGVPTLQISGELTRGDGYPTHDDIREALPHATHATIAGQGHVAFAGDPEAFVKVVLDFTSANESATDRAGFPGS